MKVRIRENLTGVDVVGIVTWYALTGVLYLKGYSAIGIVCSFVPLTFFFELRRVRPRRAKEIKSAVRSDNR